MKIIKIIALTLILLGIYNFFQISRYMVRDVNISSNKLNQDLRITQISDFHSNKLIDQNSLLDEIQNFDPHIIVLTGDIIDRRKPELETAIEFLDRLAGLNRDIYYISGNHELANKNYIEFLGEIEKLGINIMDEKKLDMELLDSRISLYGVSFNTAESTYLDLKKDMDKANYNILLSHSPDRLEYILDREDLVLAGHTHGGQVRIPFIGAIVAPGQGIFPKYQKGLYRLGETDLYIDSGLGNSLLPIRILNPVQISNIVLKAGEEDVES